MTSRATCAGWWRRGATRRYGRRRGRAGAGGLGPDRPRAVGHRRPRLRRVLPRGLGHRRGLPPPGHLLPGPRLGGQFGRLLRPRASPTSTPSRSACSSSGSCHRAATGRPTSTWTSSRAGGRRSSSTSTSATAAAMPPRWPTSSPTARVRPSATSARRSATRSSRWTPGPAASTSGTGRAGSVIPADPAPAGGPAGSLPPLVAELATEALGRPRHLGIHSAGMVICDRPVVEVCPVEWGRMPGRTVLQWDKDDGAAIGLVKFDLLGLGMLEALHRTVDLVGDHHGVTVDLGALPQEPEVYDLPLCGRHGRGLPGREPGPDGHLAPGASPLLLRPGDRGGADPPRPHPGQRGQPLHPPPARPRARHLPAPAARADPAGARSGSRCSKSSSWRWRWPSPGSARRRRTSCARPWRPSARPTAWPGYATASTPAWPPGASPGRRRTPSTGPSPLSPTSASPSPTRCPSPISSTRRPG